MHACVRGRVRVACDLMNMCNIFLGNFPEIWEIHLPKHKQLQPQTNKSS